MATNLALDDDLIIEVQKIGGFTSKRVAVNTALQEFIQRHKQAEIIELFGRVDMSPEYDYKKLRT